MVTLPAWGWAGKYKHRYIRCQTGTNIEKTNIYQFRSHVLLRDLLVPIVVCFFSRLESPIFSLSTSAYAYSYECTHSITRVKNLSCIIKTLICVYQWPWVAIYVFFQLGSSNPTVTLRVNRHSMHTHLLSFRFMDFCCRIFTGQIRGHSVSYACTKRE